MAKKKRFSCGTNAGNPEPARWAYILGSQSERGIHYILPAHGFSHIIKSDIQGVFRGTSTQRSLQTYGQVTNSQQGLIETGI